MREGKTLFPFFRPPPSPNNLVLDILKRGHSAFFVCQRCVLVRAGLTQPSLLFHNTCYGCSRTWAKQTKRSIYIYIYKNTTTHCSGVEAGEVDTLLGQESLEETKLTVFLLHCEKRKKIQSMIIDTVWKSSSFVFFGKVLDSTGCNQEGGGGGGDVRYSTPQKQGARGEGEEEVQWRKGWGRDLGWVVVGGETRPLIYLFSPLLFQALEKKAKEECKKGEKGYHVSTSRYKEKN